MHILMMILDVLLPFSSSKHVEFFNTLKIEQQFAIMTLGRDAKVTEGKNQSMTYSTFF